MKNGAAKLTWIKTQIEAGKTVYFSSQIRITKITKKHVDLIQIGKDGGLYIYGKCYDYLKLSAQ